MTYFADLTPYTYGGAKRERAPLLNVGWLAAGRPYPTQEPERCLVEALLRCCLRPENLYRGIHDCDLCLEPPDDGIVGEYEGRRVPMGNGEIRVTGPDNRCYAAPTLVAHYVAAHHYAPPPAFVDGVLRRAAAIEVLHGEPRARVAAMTSAERFHLCLHALELLQEQRPDPWLGDAITALKAASPAIDPRVSKQYQREVQHATSVLRGNARRRDAITEATTPMCDFFVCAGSGDNEMTRKVTTALAASVLERTHEAGLRGWTSDTRPPPWSPQRVTALRT